jgi:capsid protein
MKKTISMLMFSFALLLVVMPLASAGQLEEPRPIDQDRIEKQMKRHPRHARAFGRHMSEVLGMTKEEIRAEIEAGSTIEELVEEQGLDFDEVKAELKAEHKEKMESAEQEHTHRKQRKHKGEWLNKLVDFLDTDHESLKSALEESDMNLHEYLESLGYDKETLKNELRPDES